MVHLPYNYIIQPNVVRLLVQSGIDIERLRGKVLFVTGGTGFFGVWLLSSLMEIKKDLDGDLRIIVLSRSSVKFIEKFSDFNFKKYIEFVDGDIRTFEINNMHITHLVHMATTNANETFAGEDQLKKLEVLYEGTKNVIEQCGNTLENVLFTSSGVAYGENSNEHFAEQDLSRLDTLNVNSALGLGKITSEYLINYYSKKMNYNFSIARCFAFAGPFLPLDLHYAFGNFINNAVNNEDIIIRGDGEDLRSYLYIGDAIAWILRLLMNPNNSIYNVGSEQAISIKKLANKIATKSPNNQKVIVLGDTRNIDNFRRTSYVPSTQKILKDFIDLKEWTSIDEIIEEMLNMSSIKGAVKI